MQDTAQTSTPAHALPRAIAYVDGFNLYFGVLQGNPSRKWLNLRAFIKNLRPNEDLAVVRYFTALVDPDAHISNRRDRQKRYLKALGTCGEIEVVFGKYQLREVTCRARCRERYQVPEEKKTDVGLAVRMLSDAMDGLMDRIVLVSADSDLEPAVEWIRKRYPSIKVTVYIPQDQHDPNPRRNDTYRNMGVDAKPLPTADLHRFQFPHRVDLGSGRTVERPNDWK
ncbi:MAG: NYN domain-containing protein [Akkermansiaceae bacterium]|nr:NYN domain-containing protein [Akkermansiaceae bacterium]